MKKVTVSFAMAVWMMLLMIVGAFPTAVAFAEDDTALSGKSIWKNQITDVEVLPDNPENGTIVFVVATMPEEALNRTVKAAVSYGPAYETLKCAKMSGMNSFVDSVEMEPGSYFCSYFVSNDDTMDYPVEARDDAYTIEVTADSCTVVYLDVSPISWYESVTGHPRYYEKAETVENNEGFDTSTTGQIGCWLTVPETFGSTVVVYMQNLFTDQIITLNLYSSNDYTAVETNAGAGRYKVVGTRVMEDGENRFTVECEQDSLTTNDNEGFHLTIYDSAHPDAAMVTPSRDNNSTVQKANDINKQNEKEDAVSEPESSPEPTSEPEEVEPAQNGNNSVVLIIAVAIISVFVAVAIFMAYLWWKNQREE